jgi:hypothetical protein
VEQDTFQGTSKNDQKKYENVFNILSYLRNDNQSYNEIPLYSSQNGYHHPNKNNKCGEDV